MSQVLTTSERKWERKWIIVYAVTGFSSLIAYGLGIYEKVGLDAFHGDYQTLDSYMYSKWSAIGFDLAVGSMNVVVFLYSIACRLKKNPIKRGYRLENYWDVFIPAALICIFWFALFVTMAIFVNQGLYCTYGQTDCRLLSPSTQAELNAITTFSFFAFTGWLCLSYDAMQLVKQTTRNVMIEARSRTQQV